MRKVLFCAAIVWIVELAGLLWPTTVSCAEIPAASASVHAAAMLKRDLSDANIMNYALACDALQDLSLPQIRQLLREGKGHYSPRVIRLIKKFIKKKAGIFTLVEDMLIGNIPRPAPAPGNGKASLENLDPQREYYYPTPLLLSFAPAQLTQRTDALWTAVPLSAAPLFKAEAKKTPVLIADKMQTSPETGTVRWEFDIPGEMVTNFVFDLRQWMKSYQEPAPFIAAHKKGLLLSNEDAVFLLDPLRGRFLWRFTPEDDNGERLYQTLRHPHHNSRGRMGSLSEGVVFVQLRDRFCAVNADDIFRPQLLWARELAEFTLCTVPAVCGKTVVCGLINARGELWVCGFDRDSGELAWSSAVGITSFLSPGCPLFSVDGEKVVLGTNCGLVLRIDARTGRLDWVRKYTPRTYDLFDYWDRRLYENKFTGAGDIEYDTQFITADGEGRVFYKPRESPYLYWLEEQSGSLVNAVYVDREEMHVLGAYRNNLVFYRRQSEFCQTAGIFIVDAASGKTLAYKAVPDGLLRGVVSASSAEISFRIGDVIHELEFQDGKVLFGRVRVDASGWLVSRKGGASYLLDGNQLRAVGQESPPLDPAVAAWIRRRDNKVVQLTNVLESYWPVNADLSEDPYSGASNASMQIIAGNPAGLAKIDFSARGIIEAFKDVFVSCAGIDLRLGNILERSGAAKPVVGASWPVEDDLSDYRVRSEALNVLPLQKIRGARAGDCFLALKFDQLLCIHESGSILWQTKIFYPALDLQTLVDDKEGLYGGAVSAYLVDGVLIINDGVNVIARDLLSGKYLWGNTCNGEVFAAAKIPDLEPLRPQSAAASGADLYRERVKPRIAFTEHQVVLTRGSRSWLIDPRTGIASSTAALPVEWVDDVATSGNRIYLLGQSPRCLLILDETGTLCTKTDFGVNARQPLRFVKPEPLKAGRLYVSSGEGIWSLDPSAPDQGCRRELKLRQTTDAFFSEDAVVVVSPGKAIAGFTPFSEGLREAWRYVLPAGNDQRYIQREDINARSYARAGARCLLVPEFDDEIFFIVCIDLSSGEERWRTAIGESPAAFCGITAGTNEGRSVSVVVSSIRGPADPAMRQRMQQASRLNVNNVLFEVDMDDGRIIAEQSLSTTHDRFYGDIIVEDTERYRLISLHGKLLVADRKTGED